MKTHHYAQALAKVFSDAYAAEIKAGSVSGDARYAAKEAVRAFADALQHHVICHMPKGDD